MTPANPSPCEEGTKIRYAIDSRPVGLGKPSADPTKVAVPVICDDYNLLPMQEIKKIQELERRELGKKITGPLTKMEEVKVRGLRPVHKILGNQSPKVGDTSLIAMAERASPIRKEGKKYIPIQYSKDAPALGRRTFGISKSTTSPYATDNLDGENLSSKRFTKPTKVETTTTITSN
jgi:hypothetical protein